MHPSEPDAMLYLISSQVNYYDYIIKLNCKKKSLRLRIMISYK